MIRLCVNCIFLDKTITPFPCRFYKEIQLDLVTGEITQTQITLASDERKNPEKCGEQATWFAERPKNFDNMSKGDQTILRTNAKEWLIRKMMAEMIDDVTRRYKNI